MKRTFNQTLAAYKKDTAGNMGMMLAVSTAALIGFLAVAVDLTNAFSAKQRLQDTTDAVALFCLLYTSPSPRDATLSRMPSSA